MEEPVDRIEDCDGKQSDCLVQCVCDLVSEMHQVVAEKILQYDQDQGSDHRCFACIIALFLMANKCLVDGNPEFNRDGEKVKKHSRDVCRTIDLDNIQWDPEKSSQTESNLWTLAAMREVGDNISEIVTDQRFRNCIESLKCHNSPVLGLMLWLFPEFFAFEELLMHVEKITMDNYAWLTRDKMLFGLACMRDSRFKEIASRVINEWILSLQLDTGAFATVEGKEEKGDLISSAIGLLALISCVRHDNSKDSLREATLKTVRWLIDHPAVKRYLVDELPSEEKCIDMLDSVWVFYALSQYMTLIID